MMRTMIRALGELDCTALVSTGPWVDRSELGSPPPNVHVTEYVPQKLVLACADLFVTHAGYASVRESVRAATPMVTIPLIADTLYTADRAAEYGIARNVPLGCVTPEGILEACVDVVSDNRYALAVRRLQRQMLSLHSLDDLVADVEQLTMALRRG
jgi:N-glycosyltransferase